MSAETDPVDSAAMLDRIAAWLGTTREDLRRRATEAESGRKAAPGTVLDLLADPNGARIARAFLDVAEPAERRALADTVVAVAATMNLKRSIWA